MNDPSDLELIPVEEIFELMIDNLYDGYPDAVVQGVREVLSREVGPQEVLTRGLVAGMDIVGNDFRDYACGLRPFTINEERDAR